MMLGMQKIEGEYSTCCKIIGWVSLTLLVCVTAFLLVLIAQASEAEQNERNFRKNLRESCCPSAKNSETLYGYFFADGQKTATFLRCKNFIQAHEMKTDVIEILRDVCYHDL